MSRAGTIILFGILVMLTPFSGLPVAVRTFLTVVSGACIVGIGILIRSRDAKKMLPPQVESATSSAPMDGML